MSANPNYSVIKQTFDSPKFCASDICFNTLTLRQIRQGNNYCSKACSNRATRQKFQPLGTKIASDKRRGCNPNRHIMIRVDGKRVYLHRHIVEQQIGCKLGRDEIVHHIDRDKHHNCFWKNMCDVCIERGYPNLEVIVGQDAHAKMHEHDLRKARKKR